MSPTLAHDEKTGSSVKTGNTVKNGSTVKTKSREHFG